MDRKPSVPTQQQIKLLHQKEIFLKALQSGGISRAELREMLGISFPAVSVLVEELLKAGILFEDGTQAPGQRGRPRSLLQVRGEALAIPAAALTAEGYRCSLFDCRGQLLETDFLPLSGDREDMEVLSRPLEDWLRKLKASFAVGALLLTAPGNFDTEGALSSTVLGFATPVKFLSRLRETLALPVFFYNNADCFAYGEQYAQTLPEDYIVISIARGVGSGIIRHGKVFGSGNLRAGEIGHISIDHRGPLCPCGSRGCLERYVRISQLCREAGELLGLPEVPDFRRVCDLARREDPRILGLIREKAELLALGISNMLAMQPVSHVVIGGGIEELGQPFLEALRQSIRTTGLRKYMDRVTVIYAAGTPGSEAQGAMRIFLDHDLQMDMFPHTNS